jgi:hypothetical protein
MILSDLFLDSFKGVNINANKNPIAIAAIETAMVIKVAKKSSSPQPVSPNERSSI